MEATAAFLLLLVLCDASDDDAGDKARFCSRERLLGLFLPFFLCLLLRGVPALLLFLLLLLPFLLDILLLPQQVGESVAASARLYASLSSASHRRWYWEGDTSRTSGLSIPRTSR